MAFPPEFYLFFVLTAVGFSTCQHHFRTSSKYYNKIESPGCTCVMSQLSSSIFVTPFSIDWISVVTWGSRKTVKMFLVTNNTLEETLELRFKLIALIYFGKSMSLKKLFSDYKKIRSMIISLIRLSLSILFIKYWVLVVYWAL